MENLISRHRNVSILVAVLFAQVLGLAVQVKRSTQSEETRLIRLWTVSTITPFEKGLVWIQQSVSSTWRNYVYLRGVRAENRELKQQIGQMRIQQVRLAEDAEQARRLQVLLAFKEKYIAKTVAAQVIGSSGSEQSRSVYIDKGSADGIKTDQAVITAEGIVGKVIDVYQEHTAKVLLVNDQSSGVGVVLEKSRLQGILRGTPSGQLVVEKILSDESVQPGERVLTSGGDQIFPKGLQVGSVREAVPGKDSFLHIALQSAANLSKLEEVLVVTEVDSRAPTVAQAGTRVRAADILAERLPSVPVKSAIDAKTAPSSAAANAGATAGNRAQTSPNSNPGAPKVASSTGAQGASPTSAASSGVPRKAADAAAGSNIQSHNAEPGDSVQSDTRVSPSAASVPRPKLKPSDVVPTSTGSAKPSLVTGSTPNAASATGKPEAESAVPAKAPAAPPEDNRH